MRDDPLALCPLFVGADAEDRLWLMDKSSRRRFARGQIVFMEGDPAQWLLLVESGHLAVCVHSPRGDELIVDTVGPSQAVGEIGVLANGRRLATVQALAPTQCVVVPRAAIVSLVERRPAVAKAMLLALAEYVHRSTGIAADLVFLDLPRRVAKWLLEHCPPDGGRLQVALTQQQLAAALGASRQRVNASLSELERRGWIERTPRGCVVHQREELAAFVRR